MNIDQIKFNADQTRCAVFSPCEQFRYSLEIENDASNPKRLAVVGLNPSTADEMVDDRTVRRCRDFATRWGYGGIVMLNLYAFRSTDPDVMFERNDRVGVHTDHYLNWWFERVEGILCAWGVFAEDWRISQILPTLAGHANKVVILGRSRQGRPRHPLYMPGDTQPQRFFE